MSKRFRCGRLSFTKSGKVKKVDLENGGGSRFCNWHSKHMTLDDVHYSLLNIFHLNECGHETSLYDFQLQPLNVDQYATFSEYVYNNGLNCVGTVIYICTHETDGSDESRTIPEKKEENLAGTMSGTLDLEHMIKVEPSSDLQDIYQLLSEYSFKNTSHDLVKQVRQLLNENRSDQPILQFFEYICIIHGYICSTIDRLQQQCQLSNEYLQSINPSEMTLYSNSLNEINDICQLALTLLKENKDVQYLSLVLNLFLQFHQNFKNLHNQWLQYIESKNNQSCQLAKSIISRSNTFSQNSMETSSVLPKEELLNQFEFIHHSHKCLDDLFTLMLDPCFSTFQSVLRSSIDKVESLQATFDFKNEISICQALSSMNSVKDLYTRTFNGEAFISFKQKMTRPIKQAYQQALRALVDLCKTNRININTERTFLYITKTNN